MSWERNEVDRPQKKNHFLRARVPLLRSGILALAIVAAGSFGAPARGADADGAKEAKRIFTQRCTACHTFGKGVKVCADLKGVTERRDRAWLIKFIRASKSVVDSGDATATAVFAQYKQVQMPDWKDLSEDQVGNLLDWFAANGPEHIDLNNLSADLATQGDIDSGRALFAGGARLTSGGIACKSCHNVRDASAPSAGTFGPDLTHVYVRYGDRALGTFLKHPCFRRAPDSAANEYLTAQEIFALKSYLRRVALDSHTPDTNRGK
ncbi:MAG TPA: c-type cytochrome [Polyangiaceae bacterium]|nr:c-type cytochrome [Polyangiaceae bacterium]